MKQINGKFVMEYFETIPHGKNNLTAVLELTDWMGKMFEKWRNGDFTDVKLKKYTEETDLLESICKVGLQNLTGIYEEDGEGVSFYVIPNNTGGGTLHYNPLFFINATLTSAINEGIPEIDLNFITNQLFFLVCHEMQHIVYAHGNDAYSRKFGSGAIQNIILDSYINDEIASLTNIAVPDSGYRGDLGYFRFRKKQIGWEGDLELTKKIEVSTENQAKYVYTYFNNVLVENDDKLIDYFLVLLAKVKWIKLKNSDLSEPPPPPSKEKEPPQKASDIAVLIRNIVNGIDDRLVEMAKKAGLQGKEIDDKVNEIADLLSGGIDSLGDVQEAVR
jgi:hypothetical protein